MHTQALCRIAGLKSFPTDGEIESSDHDNAATYLLNLAIDDPEAYKALLCERAASWGEPPTLQPLARCVEHLCHLIIVHCQGGLKRKPSARDSFALTERDVRAGLRGYFKP